MILDAKELVGQECSAYGGSVRVKTKVFFVIIDLTVIAQYPVET